MKKFRVILMMVVVVMGVFVGGCNSIFTRTAQVKESMTCSKLNDRINIVTEPSGCKLYVNDVYVGVSPLKYTSDELPLVTLTWTGAKAEESTYNPMLEDPLGAWRTVSTKWNKRPYITIQERGSFKIQAFKDGYEKGQVFVGIMKNDPKFKSKMNSAIQLNRNSTQEQLNAIFEGCLQRNVLIVLDPIPGHATTTSWKDTGVVEPGERVSFGIDGLEVVPSGAHTAKVSGKVVGAMRYVSVEQEREKIYTDGSGQVRETKFVRRKVSYVPKSVTVKNPFGPSPVLKVGEGGLFEGVLQSNNDVFFVKPDDKEYRIVKSLSGSSVYVYDSDDKGYVRSDDYPLPDVFVVQLDYDAAHRYANGLVCDVTLDMKDKVTRRDVTPDVTITAVVAPTAKEIDNKFLKEFGQDDLGSELSKETLVYLVKRGFLLKGQRMREDAQSIGFTAYVGGEYRVETIHGEYYYFKGYIKPKSTAPISNTVLLVETGKKVRNQEVKESEGGSMVGN